VLVADQLRVVKAVPLFLTTTDCEEVAVLPCAAEKLRVEVGTERTARFWTFTVVEAVEVLLEVSVESAQRVVEPFPTDVVSHARE
jgi:hypothetical protein